MSAITSPLNDSDRKIVGECLQGALIDLIDLSLLAKQAHWNLGGPALPLAPPPARRHRRRRRASTPTGWPSGPSRSG